MSEESIKDVDVEIGDLPGIDETTLSDFVIHSDDALPSTSITYNADVVLVPSHLNNYRNRIDASVDEQRKYRQVLEGLSNKVKKYRQRAAKSAAQLNLSNVGDVDAVGVNVLSRSPEPLRVGPDGLSSNPLLSSSFTDTGFKTKSFDSSTDVIIQQLRNEQIRNDSLEDLNDIYREQAEVAIRTNQSLKDELLKTQEELMKVTHERDIERYVRRQNDEKKKRAMDTQHQHALELWTSFNKLRRQVRDLKTETENDLDRQRTEFVRCANNMEALVCEAEMKRKHAAMGEIKDEDATNHLLEKYENVVARTIELEDELNDANRRVAFMEDLVKKSNEERDAAKDSLKKIHLMPELDEIRGRRARSLSPDGFLGYFNTIRLVHTALQNKNNEIKDYKRRCSEYQDKLSERESRLTRMEESWRKTDEEYVDLKKENDKMQRDKEEIERKFQCLNERFERLDAEKNETQRVIGQLQNEIHLLNINHQETLNEMFITQQKELAERRKYFEDELEERNIDSTEKLLVLKNELEKYKSAVEELRDQLRNAQADYMAERRRMAEKENIILEHQLALRNSRDENNDIKLSINAKDIHIAELQRHTDNLKLEVKQKDETLRELRNEKSVLETENASLLANVNSLRIIVTKNKKIMEQNGEALENATTKISEITKQLDDRDQKIFLLEKAVADYQMRIDSTNERILNSKVEQAMRKEEMEQNATKVMVLNQEKEKLLKERAGLEDELSRMSGAAVKLEKKIGDQEKCIESHIAQEAVLRDALEQCKLKEQETTQALTESRFEIARLNEINDRIELEHSAELKRIHHEYKEIEKKVIMQKKIEMEDYNNTIFCLRKNKESLEKSLFETEEQMKELSLRCKNVTLEKENLHTLLAQEKERYEKEMNSLRQQVDAIKEQYLEELMEWEKVCADKDSSYNLKVVKMEEDVKVLNDKLQQSRETESNLRREMVDLNLLIDREKDAVKSSQSEIRKKDEEMKLELEKLDQERRKWDEKIRLKDDELMKARCNIGSLQTKCLGLEEALHSVESRLNKRTQNLSAAENELKRMENQFENQFALRLNEEAALKNIIADNERENCDLKTQRDELKASMQEACIRAKEMKNNEEILQKEIGMIKSKLHDEEKRTEKLSNDLKQLENENKKLEVVLSEKTNDLSSLTAMLKQIESVQKQTVRELENERQKSYETEKTIAALKAENGKLSNDLAHTRSILEQKTITNQRAVADVITNNKAAEKGRIEVIREKENIVDELNSLKNLLATGDTKRMDIEQTLAESERLRRELVKKVIHFKKSAKNAPSFSNKRLLESRLSSSRQLLVSQEESLRAKEVERKALKTRIVSADLHTRDREARLSSLNEQVAALKIELGAAENERKKLEKARMIWEEERLLYESACKDADKKVEQYSEDRKSAISVKAELEERLKEMEYVLARTQEQCGQLEKANKEYRSMLELAKVNEGLRKDRRKQDDHVKISDSDLLSKLSALQHEYDNCLLRLRASDLGKQSLKNDLNEARSRQKQASQRIANMQSKLEDLLAEKNRLQERLDIAEKQEKDNQKMEKDARTELEKLRAEKIVFLAENGELKRRLSRVDVEHRELDACRARLERERLALKRNIEMLEIEKQRTDAAMHQITSERQALDKSLTTMEKENMELYRNCTQLQNQVVQLEKENSSHLVKESATQLKALENKLMQAQRERQHIEKLLDQRELAYARKIKLLESKIMVLKQQLDAERRRRLEAVEGKTVVQRGPRELRSDLGASILSAHRLSLHRPRKHSELVTEPRIRAQSFSY
ncbi:unnamed protein product [Litomosoides sigmodontis]|uniref:Rootletin-like coiled-coil domain-containing protein n=1 Tax=Litomosoides sigmodontis TaxID=42156 RepID=A0A3P6TPE5_LITSI|nr:unnamed protein product [Litomosoides sigmodontis]